MNSRLLIAIQSDNQKTVVWKEIDLQNGNWQDSPLRLPAELRTAGKLVDFQLSPLTRKYLAITTQTHSSSANSLELWALSEQTNAVLLTERDGAPLGQCPTAVSFSEILQTDRSSIGTQMNLLNRSETANALRASSQSFVFVDQVGAAPAEENAAAAHLYQVFEVEGAIDVVDGRQLMDARFSGDGRSLLEVDRKGMKLLLSESSDH
jgi:hypothetical protein